MTKLTNIFWENLQTHMTVEILIWFSWVSQPDLMLYSKAEFHECFKPWQIIGLSVWILKVTHLKEKAPL